MIDGLFSSVGAEILNSHKDTRFQYFSSTMALHGENWDWEAHEVITEDGYKLNMFRLIADEEGKRLETPQGPMLL